MERLIALSGPVTVVWGGSAPANGRVVTPTNDGRDPTDGQTRLREAMACAAGGKTPSRLTPRTRPARQAATACFAQQFYE